MSTKHNDEQLKFVNYLSILFFLSIRARALIGLFIYFFLSAFFFHRRRFVLFEIYFICFELIPILLAYAMATWANAQPFH